MNSLKFLLSALLLLISVSGLGAETGSSKPPLRFIAPTSPSEPIEVRTEGNNSFNGEIWLAIPRTAVAVSLANVKGQNPIPLSKENGVLVEGGDGKWAAWLDQSRTRSDLSIRLTGNLPAGESLRISLPLNSSAEGKLTIGTRYLPTSGKLSASSHLNIHFMQPSQSGKSGQACDGLTFYANAKNPTALEWGKPVDLIWKIRNASAAILHRPNGSFEKLDSSRIEQGTIQVMPIEWGHYVLEATLGGSLCQKTVTVAPAKPDDDLGILVHPRTVLPYGNVTVHWAISNVRGKEPPPTVEYTDENGITTNRELAGIGPDGMARGNFPLTAPGLKEPHTAQSEKVEIGYPSHSKSAHYSIAAWQRLDEKDGVSLPMADRRSLTYVSINKTNNDGALILCTDRGLWKADLERGKVIPQFARFDGGFGNAQCVKTAALSKGFAAVKDNDGRLELLIYRDVGTTKPNAISLIKPLDPKRIEMVSVRTKDGNEHVYVVSNSSAYAYSFNINSNSNEVMETLETMLSGVLGDKPHALFSWDDSLFALLNDSASSKLLRFLPRKAAPDNSGSLASPIISTAKFPEKKGIPKIANGIPVAIEDAFVFLGDYRSSGSNYIHDVAYNPQTNKWLASGHGLNASFGSVAAYRSEGERRLWVIQPDHKVQTLSVASGRDLFVNGPSGQRVAEEEYLAPCPSSSTNSQRCALIKAHLTGPFRESCTLESVSETGTLVATCDNGNSGKQRVLFADARSCVPETLEFKDGILRCDSSPSAFAGSSYQKTCKVKLTSTDALEGTCQGAGTSGQQTVLPWVSHCLPNSISNTNGKLTCSYENDFLGWVHLANCDDINVVTSSGELTAKCSATAVGNKLEAKFPDIRRCQVGTAINDNGTIKCMPELSRYSGNWKDTCSNTLLTADDTLEASCKPRDASNCGRTALRLASKCQADTIVNKGGMLMCRYRADAQATVELRNCSNVVVKNNRELTATCHESAAVSFPDIGRCEPGTLFNDGGKIKCAPKVELYSGSWTESCSVLLTSDDKLEGICQTGQSCSSWTKQSELSNASGCVKGSIGNNHGQLTCERK